jgi:hypothetical protein
VSLPVLENTLRDLDDKVLSVRERILEVVDAQKTTFVKAFGHSLNLSSEVDSLSDQLGQLATAADATGAAAQLSSSTAEYESVVADMTRTEGCVNALRVLSSAYDALHSLETQIHNGFASSSSDDSSAADGFLAASAAVKDLGTLFVDHAADAACKSHSIAHAFFK